MVSYVLACLYLQFSIARKQRHPLLTFLLLFHQYVNELLCAHNSNRVVRRWLTLCERADWYGNVALIFFKPFSLSISIGSFAVSLFF
jgi:hypothetical protein